MATEDDELEDEFEEYDEYDEEDDEDEDDEGGLSGLVVLLMGVVMLGAFASVVWIAYQQGSKNNEQETPYVAADPEPVKIETAEEAAAGNDREVYDSLDGSDTSPVETLAEGPEEPVTRNVDDTIGAIASSVEEAIVDDAVGDRIAQLEEADEALNDLATDTVNDAVEAVEDAAPDLVIPDPTPVIEETISAPEPAPVTASNDALSGSHVVQVGAFGSEAEANTFWTRMEGKVGDYLQYKSKHVLLPTSADDVYYRLRIGPFVSADAAKTYCQGLKERGQECFIKAK